MKINRFRVIGIILEIIGVGAVIFGLTQDQTIATTIGVFLLLAGTGATVVGVTQKAREQQEGYIPPAGSLNDDRPSSNWSDHPQNT